MEDKRSSGALPILMALIMLALLLSAYVAGYFLLSENLGGVFTVKGTAIVPSDTIHREFGHPWLATVYQPAGEVESRLRGVPVHVFAHSAHSDED
jgi:hypothetical protein